MVRWTTPAKSDLCGQIPLLKELYSDVYIPFHVKEEIVAGGRRDIGISELEDCSWLRVETVKGVDKVEFLHELERGEAEISERTGRDCGPAIRSRSRKI